mmetsp:Transcript_124189/g.345690  ORF Transcript_124189/g.345690 Transcript_124189/m.345690 type:complete len:243 (+) Transcript_124189:665-1393(+)
MATSKGHSQTHRAGHASPPGMAACGLRTPPQLQLTGHMYVRIFINCPLSAAPADMPTTNSLLPSACSQSMGKKPTKVLQPPWRNMSENAQLELESGRDTESISPNHLRMFDRLSLGTSGSTSSQGTLAFSSGFSSVQTLGQPCILAVNTDPEMSELQPHSSGHMARITTATPDSRDPKPRTKQYSRRSAHEVIGLFKSCCSQRGHTLHWFLIESVMGFSTPSTSTNCSCGSRALWHPTPRAV